MLVVHLTIRHFELPRSIHLKDLAGIRQIWLGILDQPAQTFHQVTCDSQSLGDRRVDGQPAERVAPRRSNRPDTSIEIHVEHLT